MPPSIVWPSKSAAFAAADLATVPRLSSNEGANTLSPSLFDINSHHIFVGDNLAALKYLSVGDTKFHYIYIDPPYNSGQNFTYSDRFGRGYNSSDDSAEDSWLSMITPRLVLAHRIMREDGVIFVSIDDREVGALTLLMREIFGRENHIGTLKWRKKRKVSFLDKHLGMITEYILIFGKDSRQVPKLLGESASETTRPVLNASNALCTRILRAGTAARCENGTYASGVRKNKTLSVEFLEGFEIQNGKLLRDVSVRGRFRVSQDIIDRTAFITQKLGLRRTVLQSEIGRKHASDLCIEWPTNEDGEQELRERFGSRVFDYPKPVGLLQNLLNMCQFSVNDRVLCLDFFAGSATLAEAVLKQTAIDGIARTFVLVQIPEKTEAGNRFSTISDLTIARSQLAIKTHGSSLPLKVIYLEK